jgi:CHAT domain-containing protein/Tfp pilus assembly protein PilF
MKWLAIALMGLCGCARQSADSAYREAKAFLDKGELKPALAAADQGFRTEPSWRFRLLKAEILLSQGDAHGAMDTLHAPDPDSDELRARLAMHRGQAEYLLSDYTASEADLNRARVVARPLHVPLLDAQIELRRGALLVRRDQPVEAEQSFREVLKSATALDDLQLQVMAMGNLGFLFLNTYHYDEAIYWLARARDASERLGLADSAAKAQGNLGWCYHRLGEDEQALKFLQEAEARFRISGNRFERQIWMGNAGTVYLDRDDFTAAVPKFESALKIARELGEQYWTGTWLSNLAQASIGEMNFDAAERYNDEALRMNQNAGGGFGAYARVNRARILEGRGDSTGAEKEYRDLLRDESQDPAALLEAESGLAELLVKRGDAARADAQFRSALDLIERQRAGLAREESKLSYFSNLIRFYQDYVDFLIASGQPGRALEAAESSRARVLDEKLRSRSTATRELSSGTLQQIARSTNSVLLSYWLAPERSLLWVVTPTAVTRYDLPPERKISALVDSYGAMIESLRDPLQSESPPGRELSRILLDPIRSLLSKGVRLTIVPDRALHSLNFETLPDPEDPSRYLIERATISIAPSLGMLTGAHAEAANAAKSILLIGDPDPAVEEYPRLPFAAKEIALIEQHFPTEGSVVIEGSRADPASYRDSDPARFSFIHFAAHAAANRESPLDSALILSRRDSGYALSARDVMNVPLRAELVTLSACRSAGARTYSGEGLVGLSWAFLRAGARNVVAGLWDVNDMSTAMLMSDFYAQLMRGSKPADALREAKLQLVHSTAAYRKPFYWAPFQLYTESAN